MRLQKWGFKAQFGERHHYMCQYVYLAYMATIVLYVKEYNSAIKF